MTGRERDEIDMTIVFGIATLAVVAVVLLWNGG